MSEPTLTIKNEDYLNSLSFQFKVLYDEWEKTHLHMSKKIEDLETFLKIFTVQVQEHKRFERQVREELKVTIEATVKESIGQFGRALSQEAMSATKEINFQLEKTVENAKDSLKTYEAQVSNTHWKIIFTTFVSSIAVALLIAKLLMPAKISPLTEDQLTTLRNGQVMEAIWGKLSKSEQEHLLKLADR